MKNDTLSAWKCLVAVLALAALIALPFAPQAIADGPGDQITDASHNPGNHGNNGGDDDSDSDDDSDDDSDGKGPGGNGAPGKAGSLIKWDQRTFTVFEPNGDATLSVERAKGDDGEVVVDYWTEDGSATDGEDYTGISGTLTWPDGNDDRQVLTLPILDDDEFEVRETVELYLEVVSGDAQLHPGHGFAILQIIDASDDNKDGEDDDPTDPGEVEFDDAVFQVLEDGLEAEITVKRKGGSFGAVSVDYSTADGSAVDGEDYEATAGTLSWADGEDGKQTFLIPVFEDDLEEGNENVLLELANPTGDLEISEDEGAAELHILDNDGDTSACASDDDTMCLAGDRFMIEVDWRANGKSGFGTVEEISDDSGLVWFFRKGNKELLIKVLDACDTFEAYWVFFAATTNVDFTVKVTDTETGLVKEYSNTGGNAADPVQDTFTFECSA